MNIKIVDRLKASCVHLAISVAIILLFFLVIYFVWFPNGLVQIGAIEGLKVVLLVDLVLGPLLTLIVFNKTKKSLKWDLACIGLIQIAALVYGGKIVFDERPVIIVLSTDAVHSITASELREWEIPSKFNTYTGPRFYYLEMENDLAKIMPEEVVYEFTSEKPFAAQTDRYIPLPEVEASLYNERVNLITDRQARNKLFEQVSSKQENAQNCSWLPFNSKHIFSFGFVCLNQQQGTVKMEITSTKS